MVEYNYYLKNCGNDDVFCFPYNNLCKLDKLKNLVTGLFSYQIPNTIIEHFKANQLYIPIGKNQSSNILFEEGVNCEILRVGAKGWEKGKLRIKVTLEFIPDDPEPSQTESPLDDLRQLLNQNNPQSNT